MKYPIVQHSEEDCGAASLATVSLHYRRRFSISRIREAVRTGQLGVQTNRSSFGVGTVHC
ncbi:cysteine peptidase family C39 domain-containing protein [Microseira wollei]|uniref:cysteine peptidase family C39 domain-containing protein n=1 Tax=Microseira wollei TaxID=467598 RepID=UPI001CFDC250|nr:cysteine peptidase family C39 domain-containing protein [Microseira wollei]